MPIKPENSKRYPANWKQIRAAILERAGHRCEQCGVRNGWFKNCRTGELTDDGIQVEAWELADHDKVTRIVLTIAHLDHTPENCSPDNLSAWCQKCHLAYDHEHHMRNARDTRRNRKAAGELFDDRERIVEVRAPHRQALGADGEAVRIEHELAPGVGVADVAGNAGDGIAGAQAIGAEVHGGE